MSMVVHLPRLAVAVDRTVLSATEARTLGAVRVQQRLSQPTQCELTFTDPPAGSIIRSSLTPGQRLSVGVHNEDASLFSGEITAVEHSYGPAHELEVSVRAYDLLHRLRKRQTVRAHVQLTVQDLAEELVRDLGLTVEAAESGPLRNRIVQHEQSDFDLLFKMASNCGLYLAVRNDVLHLLTLEGIGAPVPLELGTSLQELYVETSGEAATETVATTGWNALRVETHAGEAARARSGRRVEAGVASGTVGGSGRLELAGAVVQDDRHAEALAQAELDRRTAHGVTVRGVAEGDPHIRPGTPVEISGIYETHAGRYVLTAVTHVIDSRRGFVSELSSEPPPPPKRDIHPQATLGIVAHVDDPAGLGRVRVTLPAYADVETEWMQVLSVGAGEGKGLTILPDVGDHVLVLILPEAFSQGIVLGGLYGMGGPPDSGVDGQAVRRFTWMTPGGQRVQLDDAERTLRLETSDGSFLEFAPDHVHLHATPDLTLNATGRKIVIRGRSIDFQQG